MMRGVLPISLLLWSSGAKASKTTAGPVALVWKAAVMRVERGAEAGSSPVIAALLTRASRLVGLTVVSQGTRVKRREKDLGFDVPTVFPVYLLSSLLDTRVIADINLQQFHFPR
jgi:hypothetical protein